MAHSLITWQENAFSNAPPILSLLPTHLSRNVFSNAHQTTMGTLIIELVKNRVQLDFSLKKLSEYVSTHASKVNLETQIYCNVILHATLWHTYTQTQPHRNVLKNVPVVQICTDWMVNVSTSVQMASLHKTQREHALPYVQVIIIFPSRMGLLMIWLTDVFRDAQPWVTHTKMQLIIFVWTTVQ